MREFLTKRQLSDKARPPIGKFYVMVARVPLEGTKLPTYTKLVEANQGNKLVNGIKERSLLGGFTTKHLTRKFTWA